MVRLEKGQEKRDGGGGIIAVLIYGHYRRA